MGLPEGGPTTLAQAKVWLSIPEADERDDAKLSMVVDAVNGQVRTWRCSQAAVGAEDWPAPIVMGATMLVARLHRRRNSPAGVESFGTEGAVYVSRNDPDIGQLLGLGSHQRPTVG